MDKRAAKREAHALVVDLINAHLATDERFLAEEPSADENRINPALEEIRSFHARKAYPQVRHRPELDTGSDRRILGDA
jgi:hypothetical protein